MDHGSLTSVTEHLLLNVVTQWFVSRGSVFKVLLDSLLWHFIFLIPSSGGQKPTFKSLAEVISSKGSRGQSDPCPAKHLLASLGWWQYHSNLSFSPRYRQMLYCQPSDYHLFSVSKVIQAGLKLTLYPRQALNLPFSCLNWVCWIQTFTMLTGFPPLLKESRLLDEKSTSLTSGLN